MRRLIVLVTVVLVMVVMSVATLVPAFAVTMEPDDGNPQRRGPAWGERVPTTACDTVAGTAGFEWRAGGDVCWLNLPVRLP